VAVASLHVTRGPSSYQRVDPKNCIGILEMMFLSKICGGLGEFSPVLLFFVEKEKENEKM